MLQRLREVRRNDSGFTLIELLMVIVILGILAGIVVFAVKGINDRGSIAACKAEVKTIAVAEEAYYAKTTPGAYSDIPGLQNVGLLRPGATEFVDTADAGTGALTMKAGAPCQAG